MTRAEMLKRIGLTEEQFQQLLRKFGAFYAPLGPSEKAVVNRALPTLRRAARAFGRDVTTEDLRELLKPPTDAGGMFGEWEEVETVLNETDDDDDDD